MELLGRRRMMMQASDRYFGYVSDGLVLLLDGINKGASNGDWVDLVSGHVFTNNGPTALLNGFSFDGDNDYFNNSTFTPQPASSTQSVDQTFEVTFAKAASKSQILWIPMKIDVRSLAVGLTSDNEIVAYERTGGPKYTGNTSARNLSITPAGAYAEGAALNKNGTSYFSNNSTTVNYIGRRTGSDGRFFKGTIYSLRVYNRNLTAAEVQHNWAIDQLRFNLTNNE